MRLGGKRLNRILFKDGGVSLFADITIRGRRQILFLLNKNEV